MISGQHWDELRAWLDRSRRARLELFAKPDYGGDPVGLNLMVPDRPGVLAEVTTAAGELGANIEEGVAAGSSWSSAGTTGQSPWWGR